MTKTKATEFSFEEIIKWLDMHGWENGFAHLKETHIREERQYAHLMCGDFSEQETAAKMIFKLANQDITLIKIAQIAKKEYNLDLNFNH
jgi:hypothetical protein